MLYMLAAFEGGMVMIAELCGAKLMAPYFGTSIIVWASTLAITLGGLTLGYFLGSYLSTQNKQTIVNRLRILLIVAAIFIGSMPFLSHWILELLQTLDIRMGTILSLLLFLCPILIFLGASSPMIIQLLTSDANKAGKFAGRIYGISTIGGVIATLLVGFFLIPHWGLKITLICSGILFFLIVFLILGLPKSNKSKVLVFLLILPLLAAGYIEPEFNSAFNVLHESDGLLGNIKVIEHSSEDFTRIPRMGRGLVVNNTLQTYMDIEGPGISIWEWAHFIPTIAGALPEGDQSLIIGLGGGTLYKQLKLLDHDIDVVEIDPRIVQLGKEYFNLPKNASVYEQDGRHFLNTSQKRYDLICYDAFLSESPPEHLLTKQGFENALDNLSEDGLLVINFFGFLSGEAGIASRSIIKTLLSLDLEVDIIPTPGEEEYRNLLFVARRNGALDYNNSRYIEPGKRPIKGWEKRVIQPNQIDLFDAYILSDDKPILSKLYQEAAISWRQGYNEIYTQKLYKP